MIRAVLTILIAGIVAMACDSKLPPKHPVTDMPLLPRISTVYHGDTTFTPYERHAISRAIENLFEQSNGMIDLQVIYDLDFTANYQAVRILSSDNAIVRIDAINPSVALVDAKSSGKSSFGWTDTFNFGNGLYVFNRIFIVHDRIPSRLQLIHTIMHETLHGIGADHVPDKSAILYHTCSAVPSDCLTFADAQEICRVIKCSTDQVAFCQ